MNKYKVFLQTYVEAEDYLKAAFAAHHKLDSLGDVQFQFEVVDVHHFTSDGWKSPTGIVEMLERYR